MPFAWLRMLLFWLNGNSDRARARPVPTTKLPDEIWIIAYCPSAFSMLKFWGNRWAQEDLNVCSICLEYLINPKKNHPQNESLQRTAKLFTKIFAENSRNCAQNSLLRTQQAECRSTLHDGGKTNNQVWSASEMPTYLLTNDIKSSHIKYQHPLRVLKLKEFCPPLLSLGVGTRLWQ